MALLRGLSAPALIGESSALPVVTTYYNSLNNRAECAPLKDLFSSGQTARSGPQPHTPNRSLNAYHTAPIAVSGTLNRRPPGNGR